MAAVAPTAVLKTKVPESVGQLKLVVFTLTTDTGDYAAGGFALPANVQPKALGLTEYFGIVFSPSTINAGGTYLASYVPTTGKVALFDSAADNAPFAEQAVEALVAATWTAIAIGI